MTATTETRPKLWPLVVAVAACLFIGLMFLAGGKTAAHSATPRGNAPFALATDVTNTVIVTNTVTNTVIETKTSFVPYTITQTNTANVTATAHKTETNVQNRTNTRFRTEVNHVNSTAVFNVTNAVNQTLLATKQITKPVNVTNSVIVTNTQPGQAQVTTAVETVQIQSAAKSKPLADRARLAIGAGGVAVTSAAGFGFLMLRRRGRYTS